ncbi:MAG: hypothetical protein ACYDAO_06010 [Thermoplasmataceae archaeon]
MVRIGIYTDDFKFYYKVIKTLKEWGLPYCSIEDMLKIPLDIPVILSSTQDSHISPLQIRNSSPAGAIRSSIPRLTGKSFFSSLIIGIDPGPKPGIAVSGDEIITEAVETPGITEAVTFIKDALTDYSYRYSEIRIGNGDKPNRKKLLSELTDLDISIIVVNEKGTSSPHGIHNNALSAARITLVDDFQYRRFYSEIGVKRKDAIEREFRTIKMFV